MTTTVQDTLTKLGIDPTQFDRRLTEHRAGQARYRRLWAYYSNPMRPVMFVTDPSERPYRLAQEWGMPSRITGYTAGLDPLIDGTIVDKERKEVVVQNDIGWRIDTGVDYLFGKMPQLHSTAADLERRAQIDRLLGLIIENAGGTKFLQQLALIGGVYGHVDVAITFGAEGAAGSDSAADTGTTIEDTARLVSLSAVEPERAFVIADPADMTRVLAYVQVRQVTRPSDNSATAGVWRLLDRLSGKGSQSTAQQIEIWSPDGWWRFVDGELVSSGGNSLGQIPVVHIQNAALPFEYGGASDVECLIPLQDELNTRLSDRAHRIAMQSFKMFLGKGVDILKEPPGPGQCWNGTTEQSIQELGGDANCASEDTHIAEVREAMDRVSGVPPVAAGAIRNRIGNLTSAAALRITLMSLLARTERKRALYGAGIAQVCSLALAWLDAAGVFATSADEREVELHWASPLPENDSEKLAEAKLKLDLGIGKEVVLRELGY